MTRFRKELKLPKRFSARDREDLRDLTYVVYQGVGPDLGEIHYADFAVDCMLHQLEMPSRPGGKIWNTSYVDKVMPTAEAIEARKADSADNRGNYDIAEDVLLAYLKYGDPDHRWALSVVYFRAKELADSRGRMYG